MLHGCAENLPEGFLQMYAKCIRDRERERYEALASLPEA